MFSPLLLIPTDDPSQFIPVNYSLIALITGNEITRCLRDQRNSSPGLDKLTISDLRKVDTNTLAACSNLMLALEYVPPHLLAARITFTPKIEDPKKPEDYRPISVESILLRCLHKILATRWSPLFPLDRQQFGFLQRDGTFEATSTLHSILRYSHSDCKDVSFALLDISRAFDSISHDSLMRGAAAFGAPPPLLNYLTQFYNTAYCTFNDSFVHPLRGVRQGDPLSPLLFIMALDEPLDLSCSPHSSLTVDDIQVHHLAYADDVILFAPSKNSLLTKIELFSASISDIGLSLNCIKSRFAFILTNRNLKYTVLDTSSPHPTI